MEELSTRRIKSAAELNMYGCIRLVSEVLISAFHDYKNGLVYLKNNLKRFMRIKKLVEDFDDYGFALQEYKKIKIKVTRTPEEEEFLKENEGIEKRKIKKPTLKEKEFYSKYTNHILDKTSIEFFYKSRLFSVYTMGSDIKAYQIINTAKEQAGWTEKDEENFKNIYK